MLPFLRSLVFTRISVDPLTFDATISVVNKISVDLRYHVKATIICGRFYAQLRARLCLSHIIKPVSMGEAIIEPSHHAMPTSGSRLYLSHVVQWTCNIQLPKSEGFPFIRVQGTSTIRSHDLVQLLPESAGL